MIKSGTETSRRKSWTNIAMLLFSVGAGTAGAYFSQQYIDGQVALQTAENTVDDIMVEVVVVARDMLRGEILHDSDLVTREIPEQYVDSNTVGVDTYELALGQRMDFDIDEGRPLLWAHLAGGTTPTFSGKVDQGLRAMTVRVDDVNSISGFLQPGDRVDLLMSYGSGREQRILPLLDKLNVIATGIQTEADKLSDGEPRSFSTITVHVTPTDAQKLMLAQQVARVTAILRHPDDNTELSGPPFTVAQLIAASDHQKAPAIVRRAKRAVVAPSIQYIIGGQ